MNFSEFFCDFFGNTDHIFQDKEKIENSSEISPSPLHSRAEYGIIGETTIVKEVYLYE